MGATPVLNIASMPGLQPFFAQEDKNLEEGGAGDELAVVPAHKLLIIEDVTVSLGVTHGAGMEFWIEVFWLTGTRAPVGVRRYRIPLIQRHVFPNVDLLVGGRRVRWYIEQGALVCYSAEGDLATTGSVSLTVSGRFVDLRPFNSLRRAFRLIVP
jgi:hypothetical protein